MLHRKNKTTAFIYACGMCGNEAINIIIYILYNIYVLCCQKKCQEVKINKDMQRRKNTSPFLPHQLSSFHASIRK